MSQLPQQAQQALVHKQGLPAGVILGCFCIKHHRRLAEHRQHQARLIIVYR